jgi:hypothetical protein
MKSKNKLFDSIAEAFGIPTEELAITVDVEPEEDEELLESLIEWMG